MRPRGAHVGLGRLRRVEAGGQQPRRRVVHVHDQRAPRPAALEPVVRRAVDLHQVAQALAPRSARMRAHLAPRLRPPQTVGDHPAAQRLRRQLVAVHLHQLLACERRTEVRVPLANQVQNRPSDRRVDRVVRPPPAPRRRQTRSTALPVAAHQTLHLAHAQTQPPSSLRLPQASLGHLPDHRHAIRLASAQKHLPVAHPAASLPPKKGTLLLWRKGTLLLWPNTSPKPRRRRNETTVVR